MSDAGELEPYLRRRAWRTFALLAPIVLLVAAIAVTIRAAIWFVAVALVAGALAWLFGSTDPRGTAIVWGCVAAFVGGIVAIATIAAHTRRRL